MGDCSEWTSDQRPAFEADRLQRQVGSGIAIVMAVGDGDGEGEAGGDDVGGADAKGARGVEMPSADWERQ
jgi:hypothetical protein